MDLEFKPLEAEDIGRLTKFFGLRPNRTCDSVVLDSSCGENITMCVLPLWTIRRPCSG